MYRHGTDVSYFSGFFRGNLHADGPRGSGYQSFPAWWIAPDTLITPYYAGSPGETASPFQPDWSRRFPLTPQISHSQSPIPPASPKTLPPCWIWTLAGYGDSFIIMWEGEWRVCGSQLLNCQRWRDKSRAFVISTDQISLLYLYGPLLPRFVSVSPLLPHARVGWSRAFAELLWSEISSFFPLRAAAGALQRQGSRAYRPFGKTCPSVMPVLKSCFSSQVDKVSPVSDGGPWEQNEGHKYWMQARRRRRFRNYQYLCHRIYITIGIYWKTQQQCLTGRKRKKNKVYTAVSVWNKKDVVPYYGALNHAISFVSGCVFVCSDAPHHFKKKNWTRMRRLNCPPEQKNGVLKSTEAALILDWW